MKTYNVSECFTGKTKEIEAMNENCAIVLAKKYHGFPLQGFYQVVEIL